MVAKYFLIAGLFSTACLLKQSNAAITPVDETYTATADEDFTIPWTFDDEGSLDQVLWRYKSSPTATAVTILSKTGAAAAVDFNNFNVEHATNGEIKLISVTKEQNEGIYLCQVSYVLGSSIPTVTGTATLSVTIATTTSTMPTTTSIMPTTTSTMPTTTSTTPTTISTMPTTTSTMPTTTSTMPTTKSTTPTTISTMPATNISTIATSTITIVIIVSSVGGLLVVGIAIAALFFFHRQRNKKHTTRNQSHLGRDHHKQYKTSKSPYQQRNDNYLYNGRSHNGRSHNGRSQVKENPLHRVSKERSLSRSYSTGTSSRYDNYRPAYTMENVYPSITSGHRFMSEYIDENRNPEIPKHSSYPMGNMRYTSNKIFYYERAIFPSKTYTCV